jgi:dTDP-4-dehydrorhamnose 3,5-epimerase
MELYRMDVLAAEIGRPFALAQANMSISAAGVVRGIHFADVPPGQAKYITCARGAVLDVVVDVRVGSPTFGQWEAVRLDDEDRRCLFLAEGLGHAFCVLTEATVTYLCSQPYNPAGEHATHPLDPEIGIAWPTTKPVLSARDAAAPTLSEAGRLGWLPDYQTCRKFAELCGTD